MVIHDDGMVNVALTEATLPPSRRHLHSQRCNQPSFITTPHFFSIISRNYRSYFTRIGGRFWGRDKELVKGALCIFTVMAVQLLIGGLR